ncbi:class I SAM-dependent methyltransferase [Desulfocurvibacter africanus]|uniref:Methyltransferase type 11 n=1 Tax=Desulfocurvibacter africanus subsp. africanus str. Walvis Bay TaxID=690850 RepID=F3YZ66_DESAF|nr:class I SAM-dependent methyltransferase [Desulfocurvibacter africanus]EGJ50822.1 Methyltransferase type 11 [Desulfocurvibacter africanus subsp. africanus str. Walvis Bay]
MPTARNRLAQEIFAPIAVDYERWSRALSFWQDPRWRQELVNGLGLPPGSRVLDVAAGTGQISRLLEKQGLRVVSLDQSLAMLTRARARGAAAVAARAEALPFPDAAFDGLTAGYLLRYLEDPLAGLRELARVVRPGGRVALLDFGRPRGVWGGLWRLYTGLGLPAAGALISPGWHRVGAFLGRSIDDFHRAWPKPAMERLLSQAGLGHVRSANPSLGGGLLLWGTRL